MLEVGRGPRRHLSLAEDQLLRHAPAHGHVQPRQQLLPRNRRLVLLGKLHHHTQGLASGHDGRLVHWVGSGSEEGHQRMPALVVGRQTPVLLADHRALALRAHHDPIFRILERRHGHCLGLVHCRFQRRDVHQVGQVSPGEAGGPPRDDREVHVGGLRNVLEVRLENLPPTLDVRVGHHDVAIESARPRERLVQRLGKVGGTHDNHPLVLLEPVHLHQQLVQRHLHVLLVFW
mmetsp:Transcript_7283/g.18719  ORF Transcript_7283/g.18719 Transcript_7283/m.18719 type:complete len:232 (-) Transcript_7283:610-1305(-)